MMSVKLEEGWGHFRSATFAYQSTAFPMLSGTLITCAGFLPLALAQGMVAEFTKSLSIVVFMALILSWFASVLVSPVLGYKNHRKQGSKNLNPNGPNETVSCTISVLHSMINLKDYYIGL